MRILSSYWECVLSKQVYIIWFVSHDSLELFIFYICIYWYPILITGWLKDEINQSVVNHIIDQCQSSKTSDKTRILTTFIWIRTKMIRRNNRNKYCRSKTQFSDDLEISIVSVWHLYMIVWRYSFASIFIHFSRRIDVANDMIHFLKHIKNILKIKKKNVYMSKSIESVTMDWRSVQKESRERDKYK